MSKPMAHRLPKWVEKGAFVLAVAAGAVNAVALLGFNHQGVSHLSGIATLMGIEAGNGNATAALHLGLMLVSFALGAAISGAVIGGQPLVLGPRYALCLFGEACLLIAAMVLLETGHASGHFLAAAACGLQNAMTSTFSGSIVRTTHVTGIFTDLGVAMGLWARGESIGPRRVVLYLILVSGFVLGAVAGAWGFARWAFQALWLSGGLVALLGVAALMAARRFSKSAARA
jgi:uncharacterized membrane protein YoaK (UPF0700 family)